MCSLDAKKCQARFVCAETAALALPFVCNKSDAAAGTRWQSARVDAGFPLLTRQQVRRNGLLAVAAAPPSCDAKYNAAFAPWTDAALLLFNSRKYRHAAEQTHKSVYFKFSHGEV